MESSSSFGAIAELNLSSYQPYTLVDRINSAVPGLKTSAAFLTFLRANLVLAHTSPPSTPVLGPLPSSHALPAAFFLTTISHYPSPITDDDAPSPAEDDDLPPPSLEILTSDADKAVALRLIADSIVQQRHKAAVHLATHPLPLAALLTVLAGFYRYSSSHRDFAAAFFALAILGACAAYVGAIRSLTSGYLRAAEGLTAAGGFLLHSPGRGGGGSGGSGGGYEDLVLATRLGNEIVGALVLRLERPCLLSSDGGSSSGAGAVGSSGGRRKGHSRQNSLRGLRSSGKGLIRAWTIRLGYRGRGLGKDMLREAVRVTRERCGRDAEVGFAREHANSVKVLPEVFNRPFWRGEMRAARGLERVVKEMEAARERRRR
ncbi:hypothetical protein VTJ83DRAFT_5117 [Remersonia thermophila]|uniref:N-acetyltransferase domain-containing protein n=1 Tax=Remersonia thermophila TaxID=72144 RepID=A0ABR4DCM3_9PEZI